MANDYLARLDAIRNLMAEKAWDVLIVSGSDSHVSEYVSDRWRGVRWLSGFMGEGDLVITQDHAGVWTDSRYFISGREELSGTGYELHEIRIPGAVDVPEWLAAHFMEEVDGDVVICVDGVTQPARSVLDIKKTFSAFGYEVDNDNMGLRIVSVPDVLELIWENRPAIPMSPIISLGEDLVGESRSSKIAWLRNFLEEEGYGAILVSALDEIAWLLNVRGSDIDCNPVVISYLLVTKSEVRWFVRKTAFSRLDEETMESFGELKEDGVEICPYGDVEIGISEIMQELGEALYVDVDHLNYNLFNIITGVGQEGSVVMGASPVAVRKAIKNEVEIEGMREAHFEDGLVMERFLYWLESQVEYSEGIDEWDAACHLNELRSEVEGFKGLSFETISAYGPNAALPHYVTPHRGAALLGDDGLYLCDSGGQYMYGTTDLTRTVPLGRCDSLEREDYTLVLKGHIDLAMAIFPKGTAGCHLDVLARNPLWRNKRNFGHGSGHGVGFFLNVHEGPQGIRQDYNEQPILPGMVVSDEPGMYREGSHGIRHENLLLCRDAGENEYGSWLKFEVLTLCHMDTSIVDIQLLTDEELDWLNEYNERVYDQLGPYLPREVAHWLYRKTRPLEREKF